MNMETDKKKVHNFWNNASCGEQLYLKSKDKDGYSHHSKKRYELEPFISEFADFESSKGKKVLEIGVGLGADHQNFIESGAITYGIDLTSRAIKNTEIRLKTSHLQSNLSIGDAEKLKFDDNFFDLVYSWGVIHHSPNTPQAINEIRRVLKPGGHGKIMIYHKWSLVGFMLWIRYGLFRLNPFIGLDNIYSKYLESPGTKAYSKKEAYELLKEFNEISVNIVLTHGDLLEGSAGQRQAGILINLARKIWPRTLIKKFLSGLGLFMLIDVKK
jgi:ubiquinone/menaquinone biosynthesis C-methylase UbiE